MAKNNNTMKIRDNSTIKWRLEQLERQINLLDEKVEQIMSNGIPHLREDMATIKSWMKVWAVFNFGAIVLSAVLLRFL